MACTSNAMPGVITHNYNPEGRFLANLCDLAEPDAETLLERIRLTNKRTIKANYLSRRLATEAWLISERQRPLGATRRETPVYFFLGNFADGLDPSQPSSLVMPLAAFSPDMLTFTYPDSMASLSLATRADHQAERQPYHGRVFTLDEIRLAIDSFGMPRDRWRTDPRKRFDRFIEMQIWDERPIIKFVSADKNPFPLSLH